jgi:UDP-3-O-[3-hydroxymyristoyl] glucosamine N-acyltransferase
MPLRPFRLTELARLTGAVLEGDDLEVSGAAGLDEAASGELSFVRASAQARQATASRAAALVVPQDYPAPDRAVLRHSNPRWVFSVALALLAPPERAEPGVHPSAVIDPTASIGAECAIGPYAVIESHAVIGDRAQIGSHAVVGRRARLGADCRLDAHAVVYHDCTIGARTTLYAHAVVGCDGFGFEVHEGKIHRLNHIGTAVLGDDVEVGAGSCVDRATTGQTAVGPGSKIDNLVQIGHNCTIGRGTLIAAQVAMGGSTKVGNGVMIGGAAMISDHSTIGDGCKIGGGSGIMNEVPRGSTYFGYVARDHRQYLRELVAIRRLPDLLKEVESLRREVASWRRDAVDPSAATET